ncbi:MAG TPA: YfiR family protein, partial [Verrucomicrobiae bacterium]|nr:YfiR family protein [Verrucomicrobiae bacterium]
TVGDVAQFARRGGVINLTMEGNKVHFEINLDAANRAGLRISAQLLKLGKVLHDEPGAVK